MFTIENVETNIDPMIFLPIWLIIIAIGLVGYILNAVALSTMAKNAGISKPWLAWIPVANVWIMGELVTDRLRGNGGFKYIIITLIYILVCWIPIVNAIAGMAYGIFSILVLYWLYEKYSNKPVLHTVFSMIIPIYSVICLFVIRNNEEY
ncbi:hypothetical protein ACFC4S_24510 [Priestia megaterium]|uniref:hypothetical protein n=1 Tax=Priestia megaterium TaxID=1404 RepID=UPI001DDF2E47|nr:hypothetical protein [Priestia megaterium]